MFQNYKNQRSFDQQSCLVVLIRLFKLFLIFCSVLSGVLFAIVWRNYEQTVLRLVPLSSSPLDVHPWNSPEYLQANLDNAIQNSYNYEQWLKQKGLESIPIPREDISYGKKIDNTLESEFLANQTRVVCMILATKKTRSRALNNTWTKYCNQKMFYGSYHEMKIPYVKLKLYDDSLLSPRTFCFGFIDLLNKIEDDNFQWILITTDHTFAIIENLRYMVAPLNYHENFYIGRPVHHYFLGVYNSFDSGIVLSRGTVQLLANTLFLNRSTCAHLPMNGMVYGGQFDSYIGLHLSRYGIRAQNTFDNSNKNGQPTGGSRFHPYMPEKHLNPHLISVFDSYWSSNVLPINAGLGCCSDRAITFTGFSSVTMYFIEYLLYHLSAFTKFDGPRVLGNLPPPYESYRVHSDMDGKVLQTTALNKYFHHNHKKKRKHRKKSKGKF